MDVLSSPARACWHRNSSRSRFALALGVADEPVAAPAWTHFGMSLPDRAAVLALRYRLAADGVELEEEWDEPGYASVKCRDPDGYIVEGFWEAAG